MVGCQNLGIMCANQSREDLVLHSGNLDAECNTTLYRLYISVQNLEYYIVYNSII